MIALKVSVFGGKTLLLSNLLVACCAVSSCTAKVPNEEGGKLIARDSIQDSFDDALHALLPMARLTVALRVAAVAKAEGHKDDFLIHDPEALKYFREHLKWATEQLEIQDAALGRSYVSQDDPEATKCIETVKEKLNTLHKQPMSYRAFWTQIITAFRAFDAILQ